MRTVFLGTPEIAATCLDALLAVRPRHEVALVVTQPDRAAGRSGQPEPPPVKKMAVAAGVPVLQPEHLKTGGAVEAIVASDAEIGVTVAYGKILPQEMLDCLPRGFINAHASLLPRWRGASPIQATILAGDQTTGVTTMQMDAGLDTGDMLLWRETSLDPHETASSLHDRLATLAAELVIATLDRLEAGDIEPRPQSTSPFGPATTCRTISKADGEIDWHASAVEIDRRVRAMNPWPGAFTTLADGNRVIIRRASPLPDLLPLAPGESEIRDGRLLAACGSGALEVLELQRAGKRSMTAAEFLRGLSDPAQLVFA